MKYWLGQSYDKNVHRLARLFNSKELYTCRAEDPDKFDNYLVRDLIHQKIFQSKVLRLHPEREPGRYPLVQEPVPIEQRAR